MVDLLMQPVAKTILSQLSEPETQQLLDTLEQIGLGDFLRQYPLQHLEFNAEVLHNGQVVNGIYDFYSKSAEISLTREASEYNQPYHKQRFWSISSLANTKTQAVARTFIHEIGHHLHQLLEQMSPTQFRATMLLPRTNALSQYAMQRNREYFAECFAAYVYQRVELLMDDTLGYDMIERSLDALGISVKEAP
jgi:hypothetical protein